MSLKQMRECKMKKAHALYESRKHSARTNYLYCTKQFAAVRAKKKERKRLLAVFRQRDRCVCNLSRWSEDGLNLALHIFCPASSIARKARERERKKKDTAQQISLLPRECCKLYSWTTSQNTVVPEKPRISKSLFVTARPYLFL